MTPVAEKRLPSSVPVLRRALLWGLLANAGIALIGGVLGGLTAGTSGAVSAVIGAAMGFVFLGLTAASMLIAVRYSMVPSRSLTSASHCNEVVGSGTFS